MSNAVTLTFAGDTTSLDRASKAATTDINNVSKALTQNAQHARDSGTRLGEFGEKVEGQTRNIRGGKDAIDGVSTALGALGVSIPGPVGNILSMGTGLADMADGIGGTVIPAVEKMLVKMGLMTAATEVQATATGEAAVAQEGLNLAFLASPVGLIVAGLVALGGVVYLCYEKFQGFRDVVKNTWNVIVNGTGAALKFIIDGVASFVKTSLSVFDLLLKGLAHLPTWLGGGIASSAAAAVESLINGIDSAAAAADRYIDAATNAANANVNLANSFSDVATASAGNPTGWGVDPDQIAALVQSSHQNATEQAILEQNAKFAPVKSTRGAGGGGGGGSSTPKESAFDKKIDTLFTRVSAAMTAAGNTMKAFAPQLNANGSILTNLAIQQDQTRALQGDLALLAKNGLNKDLLSQLANGGIGSLAAAEQLAIGGKGAVNQANALANGINAAGGSIGAAEALRTTNVALTANLSTVLKVDGKTLADVVQKALLKKKKTSGALGLS